MKINTNIRKIPEFPHFEKKSGFFSGIFQFLFGILLWGVLLLLFVFVAYTEWFRSHLKKGLQKIKPKQYEIPFWFCGICVVFIFPITLFVILGNTFLTFLKK